MLANKELRRYNKKNSYSYAFGAYPTFELLENRPDTVDKIIMHSATSADISSKLESLCEKRQILLTTSDKTLDKIREKESCLVAGVFHKFDGILDHNRNHVVLVSPGDCGNMGTIIRTCVGFGIYDLAIVEPAADIFNPKTVRASMGALFHLNFQYFSDFHSYYREYGNGRMMYPFMLKGARQLGTFDIDNRTSYALIFGNESSGLEDSFLDVGQSVLIAHCSDIDSLNLSLASGIAIYEFTKKNFCLSRFK